MRYAIFSDIHANRQAWHAVLDDMHAQGADVPVCLGDIVGYGPCPQEVLDGIREVTANFLMGNHDAAACGVLDASIFNDQAREVIEWTQSRLNEDSLEFLQEMPLAIEDDGILFVHAEVEEPGRFLYIDSIEEARDNFAAGPPNVTFVGHTHNPGIYVEEADGQVRELPDHNCQLHEDRRYIVNVGSVGEPRNPEDIRARYVIYDSETKEVDFRRVEFDVEGYRADLEQSGLQVTPYFMRVVDHYRDAVAYAENMQRAMMVDMQAPAIALPTVPAQATRKLIVPARGGRARAPRLASEQPELEKSGPSGLAITFMIIGILMVAGFAAFLIFGDSGDPEEETLIADANERVMGEETTNPGGEGNLLTAVGVLPPEPGTGQSNPVPNTPPTTDTDTTPPAVEAESEPETIALWHLDDPTAETMGHPVLTNFVKGKTARPLVGKVPWNGFENKASVFATAWAEASPGGDFSLKHDESFTFECWFKGPKPAGLQFLAGDRSNDEKDGAGWQIDGRQIRKKGALSFVYDPGDGNNVTIRAEGGDFFNNKAHHLAVVWDHDAISPDEGTVTLWIDGAPRGSANIHHDMIPDEINKPFA
ncbi:MAG: hypothetical protein HKN23_09435, partial [Verrucomicrobiales bacterium]|nr:hypothetical protein [Verrucomicrobiales bacterium]